MTTKYEENCKIMQFITNYDSRIAGPDLGLKANTMQPIDTYCNFVTLTAETTPRRKKNASEISHRRRKVFIWTDKRSSQSRLYQTHTMTYTLCICMISRHVFRRQKLLE